MESVLELYVVDMESFVSALVWGNFIDLNILKVSSDLAGDIYVTVSAEPRYLYWLGRWYEYFLNLN